MPMVATRELHIASGDHVVPESINLAAPLRGMEKVSQRGRGRIKPAMEENELKKAFKKNLNFQKAVHYDKRNTGTGTR
jgi:hypothetical protein